MTSPEPHRRSALPGVAWPSRRAVLAGLAGTLLAPRLTGRALAADGALRFTHVFGETVLPRPAERVVSLGYTTQDPLLALGVTPLAIREWFGNQPHAVWPWAQPLLSGAEPQVLSGEVSMEIVAALQPDLIVGIGGGLSRAEYDVLSQIAPVLMQPEGQSAYGTPWDIQTRMLGRAVGKTAEAEALIDEVHGTFGAARQRHPDWAGRSAVCAYNMGGETGAFTGSDTRATFLAELGFQAPAEIAALASADTFYTGLSPEDLSPLDADLLIWVSPSDHVPDIRALPMRPTLRAHREGREVLAGELVAAALSFGSVLSLPFALEHLEPEIAAALDGDPATPVASAVAAGLAP